MIIKPYRFAGLLACLAVVSTTGCSSMMSHSGPDQGYYPGTRASYETITNPESGWVMRPLAAVDLPFSALMDTLLLPWDYYRSGSDKAADSPRERILRSEKQNGTAASLASAAPLTTAH